MEGTLTIECYGITDTDMVVIDGFTTNATYRMIIKSSASDRPGTVWDSGKYNLTRTGGVALAISDDYVEVDGLQINAAGGTGESHNCINVTGAVTSGQNRIDIKNCLVKGHASATNYQRGLHVDAANAVVNVWNSSFFNFAAITNTVPVLQNAAGSTVNLYSSVFIGGQYAVQQFSGTMVAKNCYAGGSGTSDWQGTITQTTCASEDTSASGTGLDSIALSTSTFTNATPATFDCELPVGSGLINVGTNTSGDSAPLNFTTDILGTERSAGATWDVGAYAVGAAPPATGSLNYHHIGV